MDSSKCRQKNPRKNFDISVATGHIFIEAKTVIGYFGSMLIVTSNKAKQLLFMSFIQRVHAVELRRGMEDVKTLLADLLPGFRVLVDFGQLESMDLDCAPEIGRSMDLLNQSGVGTVVRVIPDPGKDIGMRILSLFHYRSHVKLITCDNMAEAVEKLSL